MVEEIILSIGESKASIRQKEGQWECIELSVVCRNLQKGIQNLIQRGFEMNKGLKQLNQDLSKSQKETEKEELKKIKSKIKNKKSRPKKLDEKKE